MNQNFNKKVGQVAGRDINNYVSQGLTERDLTEKQLNTVIKQEKALAWEAWKEMMFHPYNIAVLTFPVVFVAVMGLTIFSSYLSFNVVAVVIILSSFIFQYCFKQNQVLVQGEIGDIYREAKNNIRICKGELTRRRLNKKAQRKNRF